MSMSWNHEHCWQHVQPQDDGADNRVDPDEFDGDDGLGIDDDDTDEVILSPSESAAILSESRAYASDMDSLPPWPTDAEIAEFERHYSVKAA